MWLHIWFGSFAWLPASRGSGCSNRSSDFACFRLCIYGLLDGSVWFQWFGWLCGSMILLDPMIWMVPIENLSLYYSVLEHGGMFLEVSLAWVHSQWPHLAIHPHPSNQTWDEIILSSFIPPTKQKKGWIQPSNQTWDGIISSQKTRDDPIPSHVDSQPNTS